MLCVILLQYVYTGIPFMNEEQEEQIISYLKRKENPSGVEWWEMKSQMSFCLPAVCLSVPPSVLLSVGKLLKYFHLLLQNQKGNLTKTCHSASLDKENLSLPFEGEKIASWQKYTVDIQILFSSNRWVNTYQNHYQKYCQFVVNFTV